MGRPRWVAAAAMRGRSQLRHRWRSWSLLAVLAGVAAGLVIGAAAGARRTGDVYDRLAARSGRFDVGIAAVPAAQNRSCEEPPDVETASACRRRSAAALRTVAALPEVRAARVLTSMLVPVFTADGRSLQPEESGGDPCFTGSGEVDVDNFGAGGAAINRPVPVTGRAPRNTREVAVSKGVADRLGLSIGDRLRIVPVRDCDTDRAEWPEPITVRIVGTQLSPIEVEPETGFFLQSVSVTQPFADELLAKGLGSHFAVLRLQPGVTPDELVAAARDAGVDIEVAVDGNAVVADIESGLQPDVTTLWVLTLLGAVAALVVLGQAILRQVEASSGDLPILRAVGFTRRDVAAAVAVESLAFAVGSAVLAAAVALATSSWTPIGRARAIEIDPGLRFDPMVVLGGAAITAIVCGTLAAAAAVWTAARSRRTDRTRSHWSVVAAWTARARLAPPAAFGVRSALEPGRGRDAAPIRSGLVGMTVGLAALVGSLTFLAGVDHLVGTPRLVGLNWDVTALGGYESRDQGADGSSGFGAALARARRTEGVAGVGATNFFPIVDGPVLDEVNDVYLMAFRAGPGMIEPTVTSGRAPQGADEVLVTRDVLERGGFALGDTVTLHGFEFADDDGPPRKTSSRTRIVGVGVLPVGDGRVDTAAAVTTAGLRRLVGEGEGAGNALFDLGDGADRARVRAGLEELGFRRLLSSDEIDLLKLVDLDVDPARSTPRLLAALMAVLAAGIVVHVIVTIARVRRRDVAILRALGFTPGQVRTGAVWQAATLAGIAGVAAVVLGVLGGRALWRAYAERLDVVPEPATAWLGIAVVLLATLALCLAVSLGATVRVLRHGPATRLRAE